jgi:hypothetical protein
LKQLCIRSAIFADEAVVERIGVELQHKIHELRQNSQERNCKVSPINTELMALKRKDPGR